MSKIRLGVNIDHVATIRNARGGLHPDPLRAAMLAAKAGAEGITAHLREDRRHITDSDIKNLKEKINLPLNLEMAATPEMLDIALRTTPNACCIVPEKRQEVTTEGGLDVISQVSHFTNFTAKLQEKKIRVSFFVDADNAQIEASKNCGADIIEIHTGKYCEEVASGKWQVSSQFPERIIASSHPRILESSCSELERIKQAAAYAHSIGLEVHAGHGLSYDTVGAIAAIPEIVELNIGHFLIGEAIFVGLEESIRRMRSEIDKARK